MRRRDFLRALAGGTVAAALGTMPRQLGEGVRGTRADVLIVDDPHYYRPTKTVIPPKVFEALKAIEARIFKVPG
jgi:hypothetical protein